ncbi:MAG: 50S ribosomal protein L7/L12 [Candidatus Omnitrophica bacterium]|nr:50S ribosomal protein L7/L12 [Candidatus Omnitrophota bacterium]
MTEETKKEVTEETKGETKKEIKVTDKMKGIIENLEKMTVLELADLVKALEEKFGVTAQVAMAAPAMGMMGGAGAAGGAAQEEEKTSFTIVLANAGSNKIQVIKEIRAITTLGLKEAKDLVEAAPKPVKEGATKEEAEKIKAQLEKAGAKVELK